MLFGQNQSSLKSFNIQGTTSGPWLRVTGLSPLVYLSKNGAAFAIPAAGAHAAVDVGYGLYQYPVDVTDTDTVGSLVWLFDFNDGSARVSTVEDQVVTALPGDPGQLTNAEREAVAATLLGLANGVDVGVSLAHFAMAAAAVLCGKSNVLGNHVDFRNWADTKNRVAVDTSVSGRYSVTFDFS